MSQALEVIHRDERILVLNKPVGLLSVPGIGPEKGRLSGVTRGEAVSRREDPPSPRPRLLQA
jgi:23S rRNA-/tRNA-specific pseudouridylate synthase